MKRITCCLLCVLFLLPVGCGPSNAGEDGLNKLVVGYHENFGGASAVMLGVEKGYFREEGLDIELVGFNSGPPSVAALTAGDVDVTFVGHGAFSLVLEGQADIIAVESLSNSEEILARADSGIYTISDLRGKKLATPFGTSGENFLDVALRLAGIPREQIEVVNIDVAGAVSALLHGTVDAVSIWAPYTNELRARLGDDLISLADCMDYRDKIVLPMFWVATSKSIRENEELLLRFVRALYRCLDDRAADLEGAARLTAGHLGRDYESIRSDTRTAEWLTSESAGRYLWSGELEGWIQTLQEFFVQKGAVSHSAPLDSFFYTGFMRQVLPPPEGKGG